MPRSLPNLALPVLAIFVAGCSWPAQGSLALPPADEGWVTSDDGSLALRLSVVSARVKADENLQVVAELRNTSQAKMTILRPFGDRYAAESAGIKIWDAKHKVRYTGPSLTYVVGADAFTSLAPGEVIKDTLEIPTDNFQDLAAAGDYVLRFDYSYNGHWDATAAKGERGISGAWRGCITSREVPFTRE